MVLNMIILGLLQVATIYCKTFKEFLAVRSLFGLFMGGVYGNAIAMALEHCPVNARGLMSGILQQGYAFGYVLAACANLGVGGSVESWKVSSSHSITFRNPKLTFIDCVLDRRWLLHGRRTRSSLLSGKSTVPRGQEEWPQEHFCRRILEGNEAHARSRVEDVCLLHHSHDLVQLLQSHFSRFVHHFHAPSQRSQQRSCKQSFDLDESWCLCWWLYHRLPVAICWSSSRYDCIRNYVWSYDPILDSPIWRARFISDGLPHSILRTRSLGCYPHPLERAFATCLQIFFPWSHLPAR